MLAVRSPITRGVSPRAPSRSSRTLRLRTRRSNGDASDTGGAAGAPLGTQSTATVPALTRSKSNARWRHRSSYGSTATSAACSDQVGPVTDKLPAVNPSRSDPATSPTTTGEFRREFSSTTKRNPLLVVYIHQTAAEPAPMISSAPANRPTSTVTQRGRRRDRTAGDSFIALRTRSRPKSAIEAAVHARHTRRRRRAGRRRCASGRRFRSRLQGRGR